MGGWGGNASGFTLRTFHLDVVPTTYYLPACLPAYLSTDLPLPMTYYPLLPPTTPTTPYVYSTPTNPAASCYSCYPYTTPTTPTFMYRVCIQYVLC